MHLLYMLSPDIFGSFDVWCLLYKHKLLADFKLSQVFTVDVMIDVSCVHFVLPRGRRLHGIHGR